MSTRRQVLGAGVLGAAAVATSACVGSPSPAVASASPRPRPPAPRPDRPMRVRTGLMRLMDDDYRILRGRKVGVLTNPTGVTDSLDSIVDVMHASGRVDLRAAFGPEHGFRGTAQAGSSEGSSVDPRTGITVYDLYNLTWQQMVPVLEKAGVDTVVFDIQDLGVRFYTYAWTLYDVMTACAASGRRVVVLDRPNPQGGNRVAGHRLDPDLETLIGREPTVQQTGLTIGEFAKLTAAEYLPARAGKRLDLQVVAMDGWRRDRPGDMGGLRWIAPSPNIPTITSALVYVGTCYFEGTNLSQGRGTTQPFELIGAPYVDEKWADALRAADLPGADFREAAFTPTSAAYVGEVCRGVQTYVTDPSVFDAVRTGVTMLETVHDLYGGDFAWRNDGGAHPFWIDKLSGNDAVRTGIDAGRSVSEIVRGMRPDVDSFRAQRRKYLMYTEGAR